MSLRQISALRQLPAQRTLVFRPHLTAIIDAEAGDTLIPHLYDWYFDGVDDYVRLPDNTPSLMFGYNPFTITFRIYPTRLPYSGVQTILEFSNPGYLNIDFWIDRTRFDVGCRSSDTLEYFATTSVAGVSAYTWSSYALTREGTTWRNYINGVQTRQDTDARTGRAQSHQVRSIGNRYFLDRPLQAYISHLLVFNGKALASSELLSIPPLVDASYLALFLDPTFFDGSKYLDLSGNSNHGTPYNGVSRVPAQTTWCWRVRGQGNKVRVLVPPMTKFFLNGVWNTNSGWSVLEFFVDPGRVVVGFEGLEPLPLRYPSNP